MIRLTSIAFIAFLFTSCGHNRIAGKYTNDETKGWGLVDNIDFNENYCNFQYVGIDMGGKYTIDKDNIFIEAGGELGTLSLSIINTDTLIGRGWATGRFIKTK